MPPLLYSVKPARIFLPYFEGDSGAYIGYVLKQNQIFPLWKYVGFGLSMQVG